MESSEHNWANISETICPEMLVFGKQASWMLLFSEYPDKSHISFLTKKQRTHDQQPLKVIWKSDLAEIEITKPKNNLPPAEREALRALKRDTEINLKKADKGTTTVVMKTRDKIACVAGAWK